MNSDQRPIIAIAICILFYLGYDYYLKKKYPEYGQRPTVTETSPEATPATPTTTAAGAAAQAPVGGAAPTPATPLLAQLSGADLVIETDQVAYRFSQDLGGLERVTLKGFKADKQADSGPVELLDYPMALQGTTDLRTVAPVRGVFGAERQGRSVKFARDAGAFRIAQEFTVPESGYGAALKISFTNVSNQPADLTGGLLFQETLRPKKSSSLLGFIPGVVTEKIQVVYSADGDTEWVDLENFCKEEEPIRQQNVPIKYFGMDRHYFLGLVEPAAKSGSLTLQHAAPPTEAGCPVALLNYDAQGTVAAGDTASIEYKLYFGPKDLDVMKAHDAELQSAMHLGVFDFIARPLLMVIEGFRKVTGNFGVSIVLLTILLKVLFYPLVRASSVSAYKMRKLNPEIQALKDKFKDDKQRQQQEMMKLWVQHKVNPMKGCLPILPQIPVFFAFYQVLQTSIQLRHAPFFGWIQDLSAMDPFFVTPLLMGVAMFVQQKLTPTTGMDKTQEKVLMFMPVMFTAMMLTLPAGLTLYMLTNTVVGIAQQKWLYYKLDKASA